jgi:hypothetical protein
MFDDIRAVVTQHHDAAGLSAADEIGLLALVACRHFGAGTILLAVVRGDAPAADNVRRRDARAANRRGSGRRRGFERIAHALTPGQYQRPGKDSGVADAPGERVGG